MQNMKATGENQMICHKPYQKIEALEFGHNKVNFASLSIYTFFYFTVSENVRECQNSSDYVFRIIRMKSSSTIIEGTYLL